MSNTKTSQSEISISQNLAGRLRSARLRAGLTQAQWAAKAGVSLGAQNRYESGATEPNSSYFEHLDRHDIDILFLITGRLSADSLDDRAEHLVRNYLALPEPMQDAVIVAVEAIGRAALDLPADPAAAGVSLHDQRRDYRSDPDQH